MRAVLSVLLVLLLALAAPVSAQENRDPFDIGALNARADAMHEACTANRESAECRLAALGVRSDMAFALMMLGYSGDTDAARAAARKALALHPMELRIAAAYALARLGPEEQDTAALIALLNDPGPTVRRAAWGALSRSPDPAAREWVERARWQAKGDRQIDDRRPTDEAALGVAPAPGTVPVWFEMDRWLEGGQVFTADGSPDDVLAHFSAIAGSPVRPLSEVLAWFAGDEKAAAVLGRYTNTAWFTDARVVALADGTGDHAGKPVRLAIVYGDVLFGRTGYALYWVPGEAMPGTRPWSDPPERPATPVTLDAARLGEPGSLSPAWKKPGADEIENTIFLHVMLSDGIGGQNYLEEFPNGQYRAEVEAILARPQVGTADIEPVESPELRIIFANMPTDVPIRFDVVPVATERDLAGMRESVSPYYPTEPIIGQASGEVAWNRGGQLKAGLYDIRVFFGEDRMDFDGVSMRRVMPAQEPRLRRTIRVLPRWVEMSTDRQVYAPGEAVNVTYTGMPSAGSPEAQAPFITLVKADAPPSAWQQYVYTRQAVDGAVSLEAPTAPGAYQVRAFFDDDGIIHGVVDITVDASLTPAPTPVPTPPPPTPEPTPVPEDMNVVITLDKPVFAPNEPITGSVSGLSGDRDWIAVVPAGAEDGTSGKWVYAEKGATQSAFTIPGQPAGSYEIRIRFRDQYRPVQRRLAFEVR